MTQKVKMREGQVIIKFGLQTMTMHLVLAA